MCQRREKKCKSLWGLDDFDAMDLNSSSEEEDVAEYAIFSTVSKTQEYESLRKNKTWTPLLQNKNVVGSKWIDKVKHKAVGTIDRFKARRVAQGVSQQHGIDYSIRVTISIVNAMTAKIHEMDVKQPF